MRVVFFNKKSETYDCFNCSHFHIDFVQLYRDYRIKCFVLYTENGIINIPCCDYELHKVDLIH
mgnify:CR=1 FL=1